MEQLNKQQITLLCLLIAIFTSVASSVITASLMDKSSTGITQTIFRVVEKTIQEVAPKDSAVVKKITEKEKEKEAAKPVEPQSLSQIVEGASASLVSIWSKNRAGEATYLATGAIIGDKNSVLVYDGASLQREQPYYVKLSDNREVKMIRKDQPPFTGMRVLVYADDEPEKLPLKGLTIASLATEKLGSNVIALGSKLDSYVVSTGIVAEFPATGVEGAKDSVITDIRLSSPPSGWILLNTSGNVIGFLSSNIAIDDRAAYSNTTPVISAFPELF